ncbi:MAG TPA: hypothetical protein VNC41_20040, partial [Acidimicrobiia bacterium]|nr:hypothetical protein [Acidimicrobiia bacterium]
MRGVGAMGRMGRARMRRRVLTVGALATVAFAVGSVQIMGAFAAGIPSRPVDRDLSSYVLFAWDSLMVKGKNGAKVVDGNVGVNNPNGTLSICANGALEMNAGTSIAGDNLSISKL